MQLKNIFFYPGIVLAAIWTLLSFYRIVSTIWHLRAEYPACTRPNENTFAISFATILVLLLLKSPVEKISTQVFLRVIPEKKFPLGTVGRQQKAEMLGERIFKLIHNVFCVVALFLILSRPDCDFHDVRIGGDSPRAMYFVNYPC
jgi:hypothetical protein